MVKSTEHRLEVLEIRLHNGSNLLSFLSIRCVYYIWRIHRKLSFLIEADPYCGYKNFKCCPTEKMLLHLTSEL